MFAAEVGGMDLTEGARTAIVQCLDVKEDEDVLIVADPTRKKVANALWEVSCDYANETFLLIFEGTEASGNEPPEMVKQALMRSDIFLIPTKHSLTHTKARMKACEAGARGVTMPGITEDIFSGAMVSDYSAICRRTENLYEYVQETDEIRVTSPSGTNMYMKVKPGLWEKDTGIVHNNGEFSNLPAGEIFGIPFQAEGKIVFDSFMLSGNEKTPSGTAVEVKNSKGINVSEECPLQRAFHEIENASNLAELGIGTNPKARVRGNALQDEKAMGTCHFAFGDNTAFGGKIESSIHWDGIVQDPTIRFDETVIMDEGEFVVDV